MQNVHSARFACKKKTQKQRWGGENYLAVALLSWWTAVVLWWQEVFPAMERKRPERCYSVYLLPYLSSVFWLPSLLSFLSLALCLFLFCSGCSGAGGSSRCWWRWQTGESWGWPVISFSLHVPRPLFLLSLLFFLLFSILFRFLLCCCWW